MEPNDTHRPDPGDSGPTGGEPPRPSTEDALRALEERLGRASEAAERLIAEAARSAAGRVAAAADRAAEPRPTEPPAPAGWEPPLEGARAGKAPGEAELDSLLEFVRSLPDLMPADLERRLTEALRELLLAVRALIDWYLERIEQRRSQPVRVQDIPIL